MELYFTTTGKQFLQLKSSLVGMNIIVRGSLVCVGGGGEAGMLSENPRV